ncbi:hypothetical protein DZF91_36045 [Actinomadura logoneensis]|uniref:Uncharacterized protein n=1 Tax=Actinomadura logoneensis TaxID=2293572 RepID=A0A372J9X3_9ACTN|nr:hypothetical protein [Actinomadura logoneensis]RFU36825.1 hypothetical protein DZF91_36045 [Actinomadura logoneensis]
MTGGDISLSVTEGRTLRHLLASAGASLALAAALLAVWFVLLRDGSEDRDLWNAPSFDKAAAPLVVSGVLTVAMAASWARLRIAAALCATPALTQVLVFVVAGDVRRDRWFGYMPLVPPRAVDRWSITLTTLAEGLGLLAAFLHGGTSRGRLVLPVYLPVLAGLALAADAVAEAEFEPARGFAAAWRTWHYGWIALGVFAVGLAFLLVARRSGSRGSRLAGSVLLAVPLGLLLWDHRPRTFLRVRTGYPSPELYGRFMQGDGVQKNWTLFLGAAGGLVLWMTLVLAALVAVAQAWPEPHDDEA